MKQKQINTGVAEILLVELPEGKVSPTVATNIINDGCYTLITENKHGVKTFHKLPEGNWSILSHADEVTEGVAKGIVRMPNDNGDFFDYVYDPDDSYSQIESALESLDSLYEANDVYWENPYRDPGLMPSAELDAYRKAQQNVWDKSRTVILIKQI